MHLLFYKGEQGWRSGESTRLPPICPEFDSRTRRHMWVDFVVGSHPCSEIFLRVLRFSSLRKNQHFQIPIRSEEYPAPQASSLKHHLPKQRQFINLIIYLFVCLFFYNKLVCCRVHVYLIVVQKSTKIVMRANVIWSQPGKIKQTRHCILIRPFHSFKHQQNNYCQFF